MGRYGRRTVLSLMAMWREPGSVGWCRRPGLSVCSFAGAFEQLGGCVGRYGRRTVLSLTAEVSSFAEAFVDDAMVGIYSPSAVAFNGGVQRVSFAVAFVSRRLW